MKKETLFQLYDMLLSRCLIILGFSSCAGLISCTFEYGPPTDYLEVSPDKLYFPAEGGSWSVNINSETNWHMTAVPSFVNVTPTKGKGSDVMTIVVDENEDTYSRNGILEITGSGNTTVTVTLYQDGQ